MNLIQLPRTLSRRQLQAFGTITTASLSTIGTLRWLHHGIGITSVVALVLALACAAATALRPDALRPIYLAIKAVTVPLSTAVSIVALGIVYLGVITPVALLRRALRIDPLARRFDPSAATYWKPRPRTPHPDRYLRQF